MASEVPQWKRIVVVLSGVFFLIAGGVLCWLLINDRVPAYCWLFAAGFGAVGVLFIWIGIRGRREQVDEALDGMGGGLTSQLFG